MEAGAVRLILAVPEKERWKCANPKVHGEHFGFHGRSGVVVAGAGNGGVWVAFDGAKASYVGCPIAWLEEDRAFKSLLAKVAT